MARHKNKIIAAAVVVALLAGAWLFGGNYGKGGGGAPEALPGAALAQGQGTAAASSGAANGGLREAAATAASVDAATPEGPEAPSEPPPAAVATGSSEPPPAAVATGSSEPPPATATETDPETGKDKYLTEPVPSGKPLPVEPQGVTVGDGSFAVTLTVRCDAILGNMNLLDKEKWELVPDDGVILPATEVTAYEGESVFNVLRREMKRHKIHMEFVSTPIYNSAYIEGINNLYEFDAGELSGWMYKVNGWFPNYGSSRYQLKPGDAVEWLYSCDLGRDVGAGGALGGFQRDE